VTQQTITVFGIPNCDTVKKARTWLGDQGIPFTFHDFKKNGLDSSTLEAWLTQVPLDTLINRKGTTWRALSDELKATASEKESAIALMLASPSVIKRPVLAIVSNTSSTYRAGFSASEYQSLFASI
jgi:arsenate reductase (glutaredoxin)